VGGALGDGGCAPASSHPLRRLPNLDVVNTQRPLRAVRLPAPSPRLPHHTLKCGQICPKGCRAVQQGAAQHSLTGFRGSGSCHALPATRSLTSTTLAFSFVVAPSSCSTAQAARRECAVLGFGLGLLLGLGLLRMRVGVRVGVRVEAGQGHGSPKS